MQLEVKLLLSNEKCSHSLKIEEIISEKPFQKTLFSVINTLRKELKKNGIIFQM